jgi:hypothetical protein
MKIEFSTKVFEKRSNIKFCYNLSSGSRSVPCGRTEGQTDRQTYRRNECMGLLGPAWCKLFSVIYYTFCSTCFGCNTHPSSGATYNVHADDTGKCTCELTCSTPCLACSCKPDTAWSRSTHTCTYLYHLHVHYMSLLRMDVYYIRNI